MTTLKAINRDAGRVRRLSKKLRQTQARLRLVHSTLKAEQRVSLRDAESIHRADRDELVTELCKVNAKVARLSTRRGALRVLFGLDV